MASGDAHQTLERLSGVGPALARRVRASYGSDEAFFSAVDRLDLDRLLALDGLSERRAFEIVAQVRAGQTAPLAATDRARDVRRDLEDFLAAYAQTSFGQRSIRLRTFLRDESKIATSVARVLSMRDMVDRADVPSVARALARLARFKEPARTSLRRLVVAEDEDDELHLRSLGVDRWCRVAAGPEALREAGRYDLVIYAANEGSLSADEPDNLVKVPITASLALMVPETELAFVESNRATIQAMAELSRLLDRPSESHRVLQAVEGLEAGGKVDVAKCAREALVEAERLLAERIARLSLAGDQILELLGRGLPRPLQEAREAAAAEGRATFRTLTGRSSDLFEDGLPLRLDDAEVERLRSEVESGAATKTFERAQAAARVVADARKALGEELASWFQFDVDFALGRYASEHRAVAATTSHRLRFENALNLRLARRGRPEAISYEVGGEHPVAVLTGANSGGKSSLLDLVAQTVFLHHWGLPVPASAAEVPLLDEVLMFAGARGADAGALESFLRELFPPLTRPGRKLLLLDEVEAITELEAAGRILGVFLDEAARTDSLCVLVTHLPNEVLRHAKRPVRIDGIDAVGLDDSFNLIVDRQPKLGHRARSTPELILRRVHAKSQARTKELIGRILDHWSPNVTP